MAIRQNKEEVVAEFLELMYKDIKTKFSDDAGIKNVVYHLVEIGLVEPKRFMDLSIKYDVSDRTCQNVVYKESKKNKRKNNIR